MRQAKSDETLHSKLPTPEMENAIDLLMTGRPVREVAKRRACHGRRFPSGGATRCSLPNSIGAGTCYGPIAMNG